MRPLQKTESGHWICLILARQMPESREKLEEVNDQMRGHEPYRQ
jgi:hypothetical protein